jgi:hypothetical protein
VTGSITLKSRWCEITVLNVHAQLRIQDSFYEVPEQVFGQFPRYHTKILLDINAKVVREDIFKPIIGNEST